MIAAIKRETLGLGMGAKLDNTYASARSHDKSAIELTGRSFASANSSAEGSSNASSPALEADESETMDENLYRKRRGKPLVNKDADGCTAEEQAEAELLLRVILHAILFLSLIVVSKITTALTHLTRCRLSGSDTESEAHDSPTTSNICRTGASKRPDSTNRCRWRKWKVRARVKLKLTVRVRVRY